jgi:molybdopterin-guanine dinucleotide biosynthesis protein A
VNPEVTGAVLAGGTSSRFGSDKAAFAVAGKPLVSWVAEGLAHWCSEVIVVRAPGSAPWPFVLPAGARIVFDPVPHLGPLAGLARALEEARGEWVLAAACDAPLLPKTVIARLSELRDGADAVAGELDGRVQPFPAFYRREPALQAFRAALAGGERSVRGALRSVRLRLLPEDELRRLDPQLLTYRNANTPDAAAALEELLLRMSNRL